MSQAPCPNQETDDCKCTYAGCSRHGRCCECLAYHLADKELPGCCFPPEVEKTYDRSFAKFVEVWGWRGSVSGAPKSAEDGPGCP